MTTNSDLSIALPGELAEDPEKLMNEDKDFQEWNSGRHEYVRDFMMEMGEIDW